MSNFIEVTDGQEGSIIWIKNNAGELFGICTHDQTIIDVDGIPSGEQEMGANVFLVLENSGFELEQDWDNEQTFIELKDSDSEDCKLVFSGSSVEIVND
tara:strand:- start:575 stop:871 length:297 start_codon:yes stop_codon:yes gene_type:complete